MDARSTKFLSWDVYMEHPNSGRIHVSFKRAVEEYGIPKAAYIDNGKDYRALDFAGGRNQNKVAPEVDEERSRNVLDLLGVEPVFAKPYNARAKTIERKFQFFIENLEKFSKGYAGSDAERRPEITERRRKASGRHPEAAEEMGFLCTLQEFRERVAEWVQRINRIPSDGRILGGHSPKEIFHAERGDVRHIEPKHLGILCLRTSGERQIRRCEWYDRELDIYYHAEWMYESRVNGTTAFARRDPQDPEQAWIFNAEDGSLMGVAERKEEVHPMARELGDEEDQEELEEQLRLQQEYINGLEEKKKEIEQRQPDEETLDEWYDAYLDHLEEKRREDGDYLEADGPEEVEHEPHPDAEAWIEQKEAQEKAGRDEIPYEPPEADDETDDLKIWPDE
jgi:putative transposase